MVPDWRLRSGALAFKSKVASLWARPGQCQSLPGPGCQCRRAALGLVLAVAANLPVPGFLDRQMDQRFSPGRREGFGHPGTIAYRELPLSHE
jgi:hypothetical protein